MISFRTCNRRLDETNYFYIKSSKNEYLNLNDKKGYRILRTVQLGIGRQTKR